MKIFEDIDLAQKSQNYKLFLVFRYLENLLKGLGVPDVEGEQIESFVAQNISMNGSGTATIKVNVLGDASESVNGRVIIEIVGEAPNPSVYLANSGGALAYSNDGQTWTPISGGGTGDMLKSTYDPDNVGVVSYAASLGTPGNNLNYNQVNSKLQNFDYGNGMVTLGPTDFIVFRVTNGVLEASTDGNNWHPLWT